MSCVCRINSLHVASLSFVEIMPTNACRRKTDAIPPHFHHVVGLASRGHLSDLVDQAGGGQNSLVALPAPRLLQRGGRTAGSPSIAGPTDRPAGLLKVR